MQRSLCLSLTWVNNAGGGLSRHWFSFT